MTQSGSTFYLHIGFPKTGTTFLQEQILPRLNTLRVHCKPQSNLVENAFPWEGGFRSFFDRAPAIWDALGDRLFSELLAGGSPDDRSDLLVSDENLAPEMSYPRTFLAPPRASFGTDPHLTAAHLREVANAAARCGFPRTRVLLTVRRQDTWLASAYAQDSDMWPRASQADFEAWVASLLDPTVDYWSNGVVLDYALLRQLTVQVVDSENLLILPYELMKEDLPRFLGLWLSFLGVPDRPAPLLEAAGGSGALSANVRSTGPSTWALRSTVVRSGEGVRPWRKLASRTLSLPGRVGRRWLRRGKEIRLTPELQRAILDRYRDSNARLAADTGLDLSRYGYL
jgi:hypothetical protein